MVTCCSSLDALDRFSDGVHWNQQCFCGSGNTLLKKDMWIVLNRDDFDAWMWRPSRHERQAAGIEVDVQSVVAHMTADMLSH
eukprot:4647368-Ditylum_brightwellii.AAC.1